MRHSATDQKITVVFERLSLLTPCWRIFEDVSFIIHYTAHALEHLKK